MMNIKQYVDKKVNRIKKNIDNDIKNKRYEDALQQIKICANILYQSNICYVDDFLENSLSIISKQIQAECYVAKDDTLLFYDGFGLNERGLARIYLKALCKIKNVVYVTYEDRKELIHDIQDVLDQYNCKRIYINRRCKTTFKMIEQLNRIIRETTPGQFFFYSVPDDVVATTIMYAYKGVLCRYQINLTDHAFWLGAGCIDRCIEFREYGARVSWEYRGIPKDKIVVIPFYPVVNSEKKFEGYPFEINEGKKIVFSGGALYKTLGGDNKYYEIVDNILSKHEDVIFWYAGSGDDSEINKIVKKYPGRAFFTSERADLLQVLKHSRLYLSTYPMCGGLMFQYAAIAGCVPVTLKGGNISDGFLLDQSYIGVEFSDLSSLYEEVDRLIDDDSYRAQRSEIMEKAVIKEEEFDYEVKKLVLFNQCDFHICFEHINTEDFRAWYIDNLKKEDIDTQFVRLNSFKTAICHYPCEFIRGGTLIAKRILLKYL